MQFREVPVFTANANMQSREVPVSHNLSVVLSFPYLLGQISNELMINFIIIA